MTLRARLLIGTLAVALVLAASVVAITSITHEKLIEQTDAQLRSFIRDAGHRPPGPGGSPRGADGQLARSPFYAAAYVDGSILSDVVIHADLRQDDPPDPVVSQAIQDVGSQRLAYFTVGSDKSSLQYRVLVYPEQVQLLSPDGQQVVVAQGVGVVGLPLDSVNNTMDRLVFYEGVAALTVLSVLGLVMFWVIHLGIRPIKRMTATASAIAAGDLSHRVPPSQEGTEAHDLGEALNGMLTRLETAFDERTRSENRLRQFVGDASHELRTPITTIRGYAELYRAGALGTQAQLAEAMRRTEQESVRMGNLVDDLLHLARLDQGRPLRSDPLDLAALARDAGLDAGAVAPGRAVSVNAPGPLVVLGDDDRLRQVLANLVGNALVHTPPGSPIEVVATTVAPGPGDPGPMAAVVVTDHGPGMSPEVAGRAFERFFRADPSRSRHQGGSGLGLAIVQATVEALGGRVELASEVGVGTSVRVLLPLAVAAWPARPAGSATPVQAAQNP
jgi:two-component system, OmpR family, sensor kinase